MRALLIPQVVTGELTAESDFYGYRQLMELLPAREPSFCYLWVRRRDEQVMRLWPQVEVFAESTNTLTFYQQMVAVTGRLFELFNRVTGPYPVDVVFTSRAGLVPNLMLGLATSPKAPVPCVLMEPRVYAPGSVTHNLVTEMDAGVRALGYSMALSAYWSEWERDEALRCVALWLSPAALKRAEENAFVLPYVVDVPKEAEKLRKSAASDSRKRLLFAGRLNANKRYTQVLASYAKVLAGRQDVEVWVHAGTGAFKKLSTRAGGRADHRWHRTSEKLPLRSQYHQLLAGTSVAAYASVDEGVNATVLEMLAWGVVMALPQCPWVEKLFAPQEYPFTFAGLRDLPPLLDWLLDHEDESRARLRPIREGIAASHSVEAWSRGWSRVFDAVGEWNDRFGPKPIRRFREDAQTLLRTREGVPLATALSLLMPWLNQTPWRRGSVFSNYAAYLSVRDLDDYSAAEPQLVA